MRGIPNRRARRWRPELSATQADRDIQSGNSALLRLAFLAAIVCAVLRAATFRDMIEAGRFRTGKVWETGFIPVRSILTISNEKPNNRIRDGGGEGCGKAALQSCANPRIHDRSKLARNLPRTVALALLNLASSKPGLMLFRQTWIGLGKSAGGNVGRRGASPPIRSLNPASPTCAARSK
jgi:hypothetical protein